MNSSDVEVLITAHSAPQNLTYLFDSQDDQHPNYHPILLILKSFILISIILLAIFSNLLVILSVCLYRRLRHINNYFLVSLAFADLLVAFFAMTFNASVEITGQWNFGPTMCKLWLSMDVHVSTVSTLHLCCISADRFYAIVKPFQYHSSITVGVASGMLAVAWLAPTLISFIPIFLDWYTTQEHLLDQKEEECVMVVNKPYALISSLMTFWFPVIIMIALYQRVYKEAMTQKRAIQRFSVASNSIINTDIRYSSDRLSQIDLPHNRHLDLPHLSEEDRAGSLEHVTSHLAEFRKTNPRKVSYCDHDSKDSQRGNSESGSITGINGNMENGIPKRTVYSVSSGARAKGPLNDVRRATKARMSLALSGTSLVEGFRERHRLHIAWRKEHKAFVTLGIVMGAFLACWLPFFTWYLTVTLCETCEASHTVEAILFWIGYLNSTLNPFIYVMTNHDFKVAFTGVLRRIFCCKTMTDARRNSDLFL